MSKSATTRREFLKRTAGAVLLAPVLGRTVRAAAGEPLVRKGIHQFTDAEVADLRAGFQKMRDLPPDNPFSLIFQANIHWQPFFPDYVYAQADTSTDPAMRLFRDKTGFIPPSGVYNQCPHRNWWFLPWHRAYLYFFERILRWAANKPTLTVPYWDYSDPDRPDARELPPVFRAPTTNGQQDGPPNSLYLPETVTFLDAQGGMQVFPMRDGPLNLGLTQLTERITSRAALLKKTFATAVPAQAADCFGSLRACDTTCGCRSGALESIPHNQVHNAIGGASAVMVGGGLRGGFMGDVTTAARDPIFWLHHAQIDRFWASWVALGDGRGNPTDPDWLNQTFTFIDVGENGQPTPVSITPQGLLDPAALGYKYDSLIQPPAAPPPVRMVSLLSGQSFRPLAATELPRAAAPHANPHAAPPAGIAISNTTNTPVPVPLAGGTRPDQVRAAATPNLAEPHELVLSLEGIEFDVPGVAGVEIYLNPPAGAALTPSSDSYVGTLTFFGLKHPPTPGHAGHQTPPNETFAIPPGPRKRIENGTLDPAKLQVVFVPQSGTEPVKGKAAVPAPKERTALTIRQVRLVVVR